MPDYTNQPIIRAPQKTITFTGGAGLGAVGTVPIWTVTGRVLIQYLMIFITASLTGGASSRISFGTASATAGLRALSFNGATWITDNWLVNNFWTIDPPLGNDLVQTKWFYQVSESMILTITTTNVTAGTMLFDAFYLPLTSDASLA